MKSTEKKGKGHGHPWIAGIVGIILALVLYIHLPKLKIVSGAVLLFALAHLIIAGLVLISAYLVSPQKLIYLLFEKRKLQKMEGIYYFGWSFGWMNLFWMTASVLLIASVWVYLLDASLIWLSLTFLLISLNLLAGNFILRSSKRDDYMTLPYVDLFPNGSAKVLDAGCGAGRTTLALMKVIKSGSVTALDRFDSDYIDNGGMTLLERNLKIAGIDGRVQICRGDVTEMQFDGESFDGAVSSFMVDHLGKYKIDALREINRVLKPGGRFLLIVFIPNYATFSVMNVFCFSLTSRKKWRELFGETNFIIKDEGIINSAAYFLIEKGTN
jgi:SAM-dependent methyltransferase